VLGSAVARVERVYRDGVEWSEVEPVLNVTYELLQHEERVSQEAVCEALGRPPGDERTMRALALLYEDELIGGFTVEQSPAPILITTTPKGLRQTSGWPREGGGVEQLALLLQLIDERIESEETPEEERGRLQRARAALADVAPRLIGEVLAAYTARMIPPSG
jgi:hypothetical protein